ncbi:hypothetical protein OCK02_14310 [Rhizobium sp. TRM96647]|uniref:hypothetical protein n=1 Tax=unclassified Rhizobium TaxID=2613769 RepID=UPI0021E87807|nr:MULTISPECIES: hypothetical protein [unclassified Rhizobium]MCV3737385.1 hypothetical protein [Rhizobium sp. TRM96647]MCV3756525.1 hypothetical protein [Rhizobium sp. TRM96650]
MLQSPKARHYLADLYPGNETATNERKVNLVARALFPAPGLKSLHSIQVRIVRISESGALLESRAIDYLPDHFYLCFGAREILITCARKSLVKGSAAVSFARNEKPAFIDALARITFPLATLKKLGGICPLAIEERITRPVATK